MIDFEQELYNRFGQVKDFTLGMRIAKYFYELGSSEKPNNHLEPFDWDKFRAETARDVLAGMMGHERIRYDDSLHECQVKTAIEYADELIKQLKEE